MFARFQNSARTSLPIAAFRSASRAQSTHCFAPERVTSSGTFGGPVRQKLQRGSRTHSSGFPGSTMSQE